MGKPIGSTGAIITIAVLGYLLSLTKNSVYFDSHFKKAAVLAASIPVIGVFGLLVVRDYIFVPLQFLPSILIGKLAPIDDIRIKYDSSSSKKVVTERISIETETPGVLLDAMVLSNPTVADKVPKWIIWFNANGVIYEQILEFIEEYALKLEANAMVFNYRGVGHSTGWPCVGDDLINDGKSVIDFIKTKYGVPEENILLHGHSMGGAVVASMYGDIDAKCKRINDRSFRSLVATADSMMRNGLGKMMGIILSTYISSVILRTTGLVDNRLHEALSPYCGWMPCLAIGWIFGSTEVMFSLTQPMIEFMEWDLTPSKFWKSEGTLTIFHRRDGVINYHASSLHGELEVQQVAKNYRSLELKHNGPPQENHMYILNKDKEEWNRVIDEVKSLWH